jgi:thiamine-phosphate pyrophosphorylase
MHALIDKVKGLYAIADTGTVGDDSLEIKVAQVIEGGCSVLQYRDKTIDKQKRMQQATKLKELCHKAGVVFIINDDAELAVRCGADGVHCGIEDQSISSIKQQYPELVVGASCYNSLPLAEEAISVGADYIAFGRFYTSPTKPEASLADIKTLQQASLKFTIPIVAIGGIIEENAALLVSSGADAVAVISGVFSVPDTLMSSKNIVKIFYSNK